MYIIFELKKYRGIMFHGIMKRGIMFQGKLICAFKYDTRNLGNFHRLKNSDVNLESKMTELNENKNAKQPDGLDAV